MVKQNKQTKNTQISSTVTSTKISNFDNYSLIAEFELI
jgi:hypothetical protein